MKILILDGQGGKLGSQLVKTILARFPQADLTAVGTNAAATSAMVKAGAKKAATGENPVLVACRQADVILGPIGMVIADSLLGEITPVMAAAIGQAPGVRILIPVNRCDKLVAGVGTPSLTALLEDAVEKLAALMHS